MTNNRRKGIGSIRKVKTILESQGYKVEGPGYKPKFFRGGIATIHVDYFGLFDLLSYSKDEGIHGHQVCSPANKQRNIKKLIAGGISGYVWVDHGGQTIDQYWVEVSENGHRVERIYNPYT